MPLVADYNRNIIRESNNTNKRPSVVINDFPENNHIVNSKKILTTIPGNNNYAEILKHGKKALITGDSIIRRIKYSEFNRWESNNKAVSWCHCK